MIASASHRSVMPSCARPPARGASIQITKWMVASAVGGLVSWCGSWVVVRSRTRAGVPPNPRSSPRRAPSSTGCRPALAMPSSTPATAVGGRPTIQAAGTPHMPRMTCVNCWATPRSRITTEEFGAMDEHSWVTAPASPAPARVKARPEAVTVQPARVAGVGQPGPERGGGGRHAQGADAEQPGHRGGHGPGAAVARVPGQPRGRPQRAADQPGQHQDDQPAAGPRLVGQDVGIPQDGRRAHARDPERQRPVPPRPGRVPPPQQRADALPREQRHAERAQQHRGQADVPDHPVQGALGVGARRVDRQAAAPAAARRCSGTRPAPARRAPSGRTAAQRGRPARPP